MANVIISPTGGYNPAQVVISGGTISGVAITGSPISGSTGAFTSVEAGSSLHVTGPGSGGTLIEYNRVYNSGNFPLLMDVAGLLTLSSGRDTGDGIVFKSGNNTVGLSNGTAAQRLILGASSGTGGGVLVLHQSVSAPTPSSSDAQFYSLLGEGYGMDGSGNQTLLTPHATDAPESLYEVGPGADYIERKVNVYLATVDFWNVDRERHLHAQHLISVGLGPTGTPEESKVAWDEVSARRVNGRLLCEHKETFAEYETRTGKSLVPADQDHDWWMAHTGAERWNKVEFDCVEKSQEAIDAWQARSDALPTAVAAWRRRELDWDLTQMGILPPAPFTELKPTFTEIKPALYIVAPIPDFLK